MVIVMVFRNGNGIGKSEEQGRGEVGESERGEVSCPAYR